MSQTIDNAQDAFFDDYKKWCAENGLEATLDGFGPWLSDTDQDPEELWTIGENDVA